MTNITDSTTESSQTAQQNHHRQHDRIITDSTTESSQTAWQNHHRQHDRIITDSMTESTPCYVPLETDDKLQTLKQVSLSVDTSGRLNHPGSDTACRSAGLLLNYQVGSSRSPTQPILLVALRVHRWMEETATQAPASRSLPLEHTQPTMNTTDPATQWYHTSN